MISRIAPLVLILPSLLLHPASAQDDPMKARMNTKSLPQVTEWRDDTAGKVKERSRKALLEGPDALEKLANVLLKDEMKDADGRYVTPLFYREICSEKETIGGESWEAYMNRTLAEWRKRYPTSFAAKIASARFQFVMSEQARKLCVGVTDVERKWEIVSDKLKEAMSLLEECRESNKLDPGWSVTFLVIAEKLGAEEKEVITVLDEAMGAFSDSAYILSRAGFWKMPATHEKWGLWESWLRERIRRLQPDAAAKLYVGTLAEMASLRTLDQLRLATKPDVEMLSRGLDLLAQELPGSSAVACQEAYMSMYFLDDRKRAFKAITRAAGKIDLHLLHGKSGYENLLYDVGSIPWKIDVVGIKPIDTQRGLIPPEFLVRMEQAAKEGPEGLEKLIQKLRADEPFDRNGKYQSGYFYEWFDQTPNSSREEGIFQAKKKLVEDWMERMPESPFGKLAAAKLWVDWAWDARSSYPASDVTETQWHGFAKRLKVARKYLMSCRELQEMEPMWSSVAFTLMLGEGADEEEFEEVADVLFERFPDSDVAVAAATMHFKPQWGGRPGTWEPWLKKHLAGLSEDKVAKAYARIMNSNAGFISAYERDAKTLLGDGKVDVALWLKGLDLLKKELPDSSWVAAGEAIVHSHFTEKSDLALAAFKRMNGTLDYDVWSTWEYFDRCSRWVTWKQWNRK